MEDKIREIVETILHSNEITLAGERSVDSISAEDGEVRITILVDPVNSPLERFDVEDKIRDAVNQLDGIRRTLVTSCSIFGDEPIQSSCHREDEEESMHAGDMPERKAVPGVKHVLLICSAKGGVGKSTVAINTALALSKRGAHVGLLDLDLYGPSIPSLVGRDLAPIVVDNLIVPPEAHGLSVLSIGFMIDKDQPLIWRGPMVASVIKQLIWEVNWHGLDYLIIDMPPGTGDSYLSILQTVLVDASIVVTTPSELALADVTRGVGLFAPFDVPIMGVVENMSAFSWDKADEALALIDKIADKSSNDAQKLKELIKSTKEIRIFGNKTQKCCEELGLPIIASIPLDTTLQENNDSGSPYMLREGNSPIKEQFEHIAKDIAEKFPV